MQNIDISVIIPTFNRRKILKKCLDCLSMQTYPKDRFEVIVVDDNSTEDIKGMIDNLNLPFPIKYVKQSPDKKGAACANNLGIKSAQGGIVLFMNNDVFAVENLLKEHMQLHKKHINIIVQGPAYNTTNFDNPSTTNNDYTGYSNVQLGYFITWNVSIPKALLFKAGLFDEDFRPLAWEDVELGFRLHKMGIKQKFNWKAKAYHYRKKFTLADLPSIKTKSMIMGKNAVLYYRKHPCLETKIASGTWFGMLAFNSLRGFVVIKLIKKQRIIRFYQWLLDHKWHRLLAMVVGWYGKYWYMEAVKRVLRP